MQTPKSSKNLFAMEPLGCPKKTPELFLSFTYYVIKCFKNCALGCNNYQKVQIWALADIFGSEKKFIF